MMDPAGQNTRRTEIATANCAGCDPGCGRAVAWNAAHPHAAESAQADFATFQRRIHSLPRAERHLLSASRRTRCLNIDAIHLRSPQQKSGAEPKPRAADPSSEIRRVR